jgi:hypothetical protein
MIVPGRRVVLMEISVRVSIGAVPISVFSMVRESFLMRIAMLRIELLMKALVLRVIEEVAKEVLHGV